MLAMNSCHTLAIYAPNKRRYCKNYWYVKYTWTCDWIYCIEKCVKCVNMNDWMCCENMLENRKQLREKTEVLGIFISLTYKIKRTDQLGIEYNSI